MGNFPFDQSWTVEDETNAVYVTVSEEKIATTLALTDNVNVDLDANGRIVGVEVI